MARREHTSDIPQMKLPALLRRALASVRQLAGYIKKGIDEINRKNISILSAGIAYYGVLASFPLVAVVLALATRVIQPESIEQATHSVETIFPTEIDELLQVQLARTTDPNESLVVALIAFLVSLWGVSTATRHIMTALNVMFDIQEKRSFARRIIVSIGLTTGLIIVMVLMIVLLFAAPDLLLTLGVPAAVVDVFTGTRWLIIIIVMMGSLAVLYHLGPSRPLKQRWQVVSWGAVVATLVWVAASGLLFYYFQNYADLSDTYSLFAGVIALMLWLYVSSYIILLGAEVNYRIERKF